MGAKRKPTLVQTLLNRPSQRYSFPVVRDYHSTKQELLRVAAEVAEAEAGARTGLISMPVELEMEQERQASMPTSRNGGPRVPVMDDEGDDGGEESEDEDTTVGGGKGDDNRTLAGLDRDETGSVYYTPTSSPRSSTAMSSPSPPPQLPAPPPPPSPPPKHIINKQANSPLTKAISKTTPSITTSMNVLLDHENSHNPLPSPSVHRPPASNVIISPPKPSNSKKPPWSSSTSTAPFPSKSASSTTFTTIASTTPRKHQSHATRFSMDAPRSFASASPAGSITPTGSHTNENSPPRTTHLRHRRSRSLGSPSSASSNSQTPSGSTTPSSYATRSAYSSTSLLTSSSALPTPTPLHHGPSIPSNGTPGYTSLILPRAPPPINLKSTADTIITITTPSKSSAAAGGAGKRSKGSTPPSTARTATSTSTSTGTLMSTPTPTPPPETTTTTIISTPKRTSFLPILLPTSPPSRVPRIDASGKVDLTLDGLAQTTMASVEVVRGLARGPLGFGIQDGGRRLFQKLGGVFSSSKRRTSLQLGPGSGSGNPKEKEKGRSVSDGSGSHTLNYRMSSFGVENGESYGVGGAGEKVLAFTSHRSPPNYVPSGSVLVQVWAVGMDVVDARLVGINPTSGIGVGPAFGHGGSGNGMPRSTSLRDRLMKLGGGGDGSLGSNGANNAHGQVHVQPPLHVAETGYIPGRSFVGRVIECGWEVKDEVARKGDWVVGLLDVRKGGALTEFIVVDRRRVHRVPYVPFSRTMQALNEGSGSNPEVTITPTTSPSPPPPPQPPSSAASSGSSRSKSPLSSIGTTHGSAPSAASTTSVSSSSISGSSHVPFSSPSTSASTPATSVTSLSPGGGVKAQTNTLPMPKRPTRYSTSTIVPSPLGPNRGGGGGNRKNSPPLLHKRQPSRSFSHPNQPSASMYPDTMPSSPSAFSVRSAPLSLPSPSLSASGSAGGRVHTFESPFSSPSSPSPRGNNKATMSGGGNNNNLLSLEELALLPLCGVPAYRAIRTFVYAFSCASVVGQESSTAAAISTSYYKIDDDDEHELYRGRVVDGKGKGREGGGRGREGRVGHCDELGAVNEEFLNSDFSRGGYGIHGNGNGTGNHAGRGGDAGGGGAGAMARLMSEHEWIGESGSAGSLGSAESVGSLDRMADKGVGAATATASLAVNNGLMFPSNEGPGFPAPSSSRRVTITCNDANSVARSGCSAAFTSRGRRRRRALVVCGHDGAGAVAVQMLVKRGWRVCVHVPLPVELIRKVAAEKQRRSANMNAGKGYEDGKDMLVDHEEAAVEAYISSVQARITRWGGEEVMIDDGGIGFEYPTIDGASNFNLNPSLNAFPNANLNPSHGLGEAGIYGEGAIVRMLEGLREEGQVFDAVLDTIGGRRIWEAAERLLSVKKKNSGCANDQRSRSHSRSRSVSPNPSPNPNKRSGIAPSPSPTLTPTPSPSLNIASSSMLAAPSPIPASASTTSNAASVRSNGTSGTKQKKSKMLGGQFTTTVGDYPNRVVPSVGDNFRAGMRAWRLGGSNNNGGRSVSGNVMVSGSISGDSKSSSPTSSTIATTESGTGATSKKGKRHLSLTSPLPGFASSALKGISPPSSPTPPRLDGVAGQSERGSGGMKVGYAWVSVAQDVDWEGEDVRETIGNVLRLALQDGIKPWVGNEFSASLAVGSSAAAEFVQRRKTADETHRPRVMNKVERMVEGEDRVVGLERVPDVFVHGSVLATGLGGCCVVRVVN